MASHQKCLLDANIFIQPCEKYYAFDFTTQFWHHLAKGIAMGKLVVLDKNSDYSFSVKGINV